MIIENSQQELFEILRQVKNIDMNKTTFLLEINKMYQHY